MSWHKLLHAEIAAEFAGLTPSENELSEMMAVGQKHGDHRRWAEHGRWWAQTTAGRAWHKRYKRAAYDEMRATPCGYAVCKACGKRFSVSAARVKRGATSACSVRCKPARLLSIGGEALPFAAWCRRSGLNASTVRWRLSAGWTFEEALGMKPRQRK